MKRFFKYFLLTLLILFVLVQFYPRPPKNVDLSASPNDISVTNKTTLGVQNILKKSCYDCHSNNTTYPWYASIQPVAWWLGNHITEGKKHLNFSEFGTYSLSQKYKKLEETIHEVENGDMPLTSYTLIHTDAKLGAAEKKTLLDWANAEYANMRANYPADSLVGKK
jgi:hypothetical protein